MLIREDMKKIF